MNQSPPSQYPPSWYAASANSFPHQAELIGEHESDVVVVGGGFTGLSAALSLAEAGFSVSLLEAQAIGWGASGRNGGQMIPGMRWSALDLVEKFGEEHGRRLVEIGMKAGDSVRARIAKHKIDCHLQDGHFYAAWKPSHYDEMQREAELLHSLIGYDSIKPVERSEVQKYVNTDRYHGGLYDSKGGHIHALNYALGLAQAALEMGVKIFEHSAVTKMSHGTPVIAYTAKGAVKAKHGILACDSYIGSIEPSLAKMMMPVVNYNVVTTPLSPAQAEALIPSNASVAESRFVLNYYRLTHDNRLMFGGGEKYTPKPPKDIAAFVRPFMETIFPQLKGVGIEYGWGGTIGVTMNRLPHFGRVGNSLFAQGYSGHGVLLTTLAGELMADALRGFADGFDLIADLPTHAFPGGKFLRHPLHVAGMLWYGLRDRL